MTDNTFNVSPSQFGNPLLADHRASGRAAQSRRTKTYELVMSNRIKSVKLGRRRLIPRSNVEKYVSELSDESEED